MPDLLVAEGRLGVALGEPVDEARRQLEDAVAEACAGDPWLRDHPVDVEWWGGQFEAGQLTADSDLVERVRTAHDIVVAERHSTCTEPRTAATCDCSPGSAASRSVQYGPGDAKLAHGPLESVPIDQVITTARTLAALTVDICGIA